MAQLATVEAVRKRGNLGDIEGVNERIATSLEAASLHLASLLRTVTFDRTVKSDRFYVDWDEFPYTGGGGEYSQSGTGFIKLYHSHGFVDSTQTYEIKIALELADFATAQSINPDYLQIEYEKGLVLITGSDLTTPPVVPFRLAGRQFYQIDYTAGFTDKAAEFGRIYENVPKWLQEAAIMASLTLYKEVCAADDDSRAFDPELLYPMQRFLEPYIRFFPSALKPLV